MLQRFAQDFLESTQVLIQPLPLTGEGWGEGDAATKFAKALRQNMTDAEQLLWRHLRAHRPSMARNSVDNNNRLGRTWWTLCTAQVDR